MEYVVIGKIVDTFGLEGELKMIPYAPEELLSNLREVYFKRRGGDYVPFKVERVEKKGDLYLLKLKEIDSIEEAIQFKSAKVFYPEEELPEREENEFYAFELEGMEVVTDGGRILGKVKRVEDYGVYHMIILEDERIMFPFVGDIVLEVDKERRLIKVKENLLPL